MMTLPHDRGQHINNSRVCALEETVTILAGLLLMIRGRRSKVKRKWAKWLVPNCVSNPSSVSPLGHIITPALFMSMFIWGSVSRIRWANSRTDFKELRSHFSNTKLPFSDKSWQAISMSFMASSALSLLRQAIITRAPANLYKTKMLSKLYYLILTQDILHWYYSYLVPTSFIQILYGFFTNPGIASSYYCSFPN